MVRAPFYDKTGVKKGAWSVEEDDKLRAYIQTHGHWNWRQLPQYAGVSTTINHIYYLILELSKNLCSL